MKPLGTCHHVCSIHRTGILSQSAKLIFGRDDNRILVGVKNPAGAAAGFDGLPTILRTSGRWRGFRKWCDCGFASGYTDSEKHARGAASVILSC